MAGDSETRVALNRGRHILQNASGDAGDATARIAPDVFVMALSQLKVRSAIAQIDPVDQAVTFHPCDRTEHARVVSRAQRGADRLLELVDRPHVLAGS